MAQHQITINGEKVIAHMDVYTYRGIVELAGLPIDRLHTVTYRGCHSIPGTEGSGSMGPRTEERAEDVVVLADGAIFNVTETNNG